MPDPTRERPTEPEPIDQARLLREEVRKKVDAWIASQPAPRPSRPEALRRLLAEALLAHELLAHALGRGSGARLRKAATADFAHLDALRSGLLHECARLAAARKPGEIATRKVSVAQIEREIASELAFLARRGIVEPVDEAFNVRRRTTRRASSQLEQESQRLRRR